MGKKTKTFKPQGSTLIGGGIGLVIFLAIGLLPSLVYGGYAGAMLVGAIFGAPIHTSILAQGVVVFGMLIGLLANAAVFVLAGAAVGAGLGSMARFVAAREKEAQENKNAVK